MTELLWAAELFHEVVDSYRRARRDLDCATRAEVDGEVRDRLVVGCIDDGEEVVGTEQTRTWATTSSRSGGVQG